MSDVSGQRQQCGIQWLEGNSTDTDSTGQIAAKHFTESQTDVQTFKKLKTQHSPGCAPRVSVLLVEQTKNKITPVHLQVDQWQNHTNSEP